MTATDELMAASDAAPLLPAPPLLQVAIHILADGRVVFGDLPPALAEVARIVAGDGPGTAEPVRASAEAAAADSGSRQDPRDHGSLEGAR